MQIGRYILLALMYIGINMYIGWHGIAWFQSLGLKSQTGQIIYWILFYVVALSYILALAIKGPVGRLLKVIGSFYFAILQYTILLFPILDLALWIASLLGWAPSLHIPLIGTIVVIGLTILLLWGSRNNWSTVIRPYSLNIQKQGKTKSKLRILVASDVHLGHIKGNRFLKNLIKITGEVQPDIIFIPGDLLDGEIEPFKRNQMNETLRLLKAPLGVYAVLGNHEYYGGAVDEFVQLVEEAGIHLLQDEAVEINESFYVVGRKDKTAESDRYGGRQTVEELLAPLDHEKPILLLDHQPYHLEKAEKAGADMMISGHTHRGQMAPNHFITSRLFELDYGYKQKGKMHALVSSGYGSWGPPIRIGSRSEVLQIDLTFEK
ncbi:metallophosphoesterase [Alkalihalobacillus sp. FSL R5-0424]